MPRSIPAETVAKFDKLCESGMNVAAAAAECGVSKEWGYLHRRGLKKRDMARFYALEKDKLGPKPKQVGKLRPEAQRALLDFEYFRRRYCGRSSLPWEIEAAEALLALVGSDTKEYVIINAPPGGGKALALDTPIPTPSGWTTMKDLRVGDEIFGSDGKPCRVLAKSEVFYGHDCFEVSTDDGASVIADADHLWTVRLHGHGQYGVWKAIPEYPGKTGPKASPDGRQTHTTAFLAKKRSKRPQLQIAAPLDLPAAHLPIDPYVLGAWLGDGNSAGARLTAHEDDAGHVVDRIERAGYTVERKGPMRYSITGSRRWSKDGLASHLRAANLLNNKHIPEVYYRASADQRLALLQGLIDTDGSVTPKGLIEFCNTKLDLAKGVQRLAWSLGVKASLIEDRAKIDGRDCGPRYRVKFYMAEAASLPRKAERCRNGVRTPSRYLTVTPVESVPTQCIYVDSPDHLYLAGEGMLVTHNTTLFTHDIPLWMICKDRSVRMIIGGAIQRNAERNTDRLRRTLQATKPYVATDEEKLKGMRDAEATVAGDFGRFRPDSENPEIWTRSAFTVAQLNNAALADKEPTVQAFGRKGGVLGNRVGFCIWDDLIDHENSRTIEAREEMKRWWKEIAETRIDQRGCMVLQGQRLSGDDLYRYVLDMKGVVVDDEGFEVPQEVAPPKYKHIVYKAHYEDKCNGAHPKGKMEPWPASCLLDPYKLPWPELLTKQKDDPESFAALYQQEDSDPHSVLVRKIWVAGGQDPNTGEVFPGCWDAGRSTWELPRGLDGDLFVYATADPSPTMYWAVEVWAWHPGSKQLFLLDLVRKKMSAPEFLERDPHSGEYSGVAEELQVRSEQLGIPITHWIVEINAAQRFLLQSRAAQMWATKHRIQLVAHSTTNNKTDPKYGVQSLVAPLFRTGAVRLPGAQGDGSRLAGLKLVDEATRWPHGSTDDTIMSMWFGLANLDNLFVPGGTEYRLHSAWAAPHRGLSLVPARQKVPA